MSRRRSNVSELGIPYPVFVRYPGSNAAASSIKYIVCLNGRVPERYVVWNMNAQGVREVHPISQFNIFDAFAEDNFRSTFFNSRRCRIPLIGRISVNGSVKFIRLADVIADSTSYIISTRNIFVHPWGKYPTLIGPTCSKYTCQAYVPITFQKGFNQRCDHERLHLLWVERKRIASEQNLCRVCQHMSDDVTMNYVLPSFNDALGMGSPIIARGPPCPMKSSSVTTGLTTGFMSVGPLSDRRSILPR